ncbi:MAG: phosphoglycerate kinase [Acidimicrobiales bacterium]
MKLPHLEDLPDVNAKRVLVRCDFNVPMTHGVIDDDLRIRSAVPTLQWLVDHGATVTAISHMGRPNGKQDARSDLGLVRARLAELVPGVTLLDNLRWNPGEEANDAAFVDSLVDGQDLYVDDAFGAAHRAHASIVGPPARLPSAAGRLLAKEVEVLSGLLTEPNRPFVAILGGSKISDKLGVVEALLAKVDKMLIGGGMCFTFLAALGHHVGDSMTEPDHIAFCQELLKSDDKIVLPTDLTLLGPGGRIGDPSAGGEVRQSGINVPPGYMGLDIGPGTAAEFSDIIASARSVLWNGPMGVFEDPRFQAGTVTIANAVADCRGFTVIGGGDSAAAAAKFGVADRIDHVSTGGGATLELIEQGDLPGLAALRDSAERFGLRSSSA